MTHHARWPERSLLRGSTLLVLAMGAAALCAPLRAQESDARLSLQWWHPLAAGAGTAAILLIDEPVRDYLQDHRSDGLDDVADVTKRFKDKEVFWISGGGALALGLIARQPKVAATGAQIFAAYGLSTSMMIATKWAFGRSRPSSTPDDPTQFDWLDGGENSAFPSGSAAVVFSLATTVADAVDRLPVSIVLYSGATLNAWARLNSDRHWLSDVALGALYGVTAAKLVNGEWTVFGIELPSLWTDGRSSGLSYTLSF